MAKRDYGARIAQHFAAAHRAIGDDCSALLAKHSAEGQLRSGATLIRSAEIWERRTKEAADAALIEFAAVIETRGKEWKRASDAVLSGLVQHRQFAERIMEPTLTVAGVRGGLDGSAVQAFYSLLDQALDRQLEATVAFRDGWTAPRPRKWNERHPVLFALLTASIGAVLALAGRAIVS